MQHPLVPVSAVQLATATMKYAVDARSENTRRAYKTDWAAFVAWCQERRLRQLPASPSIVAAYVAQLADAGRKVPTIERALAAIAKAHSMSNHPSPIGAAILLETMAGIRRKLGTRPEQKTALDLDALRAMLAHLGVGLAGKRNRAILLLGFAGGFRRSELVALDMSDIVSVPEGLTVLIRRSKTDQEARGRTIGIPKGTDATCPVAAVRSWLEAASLVDGPVFRSIDRYERIGTRALTPQSVALIVKAAAEGAGLDPTRFAGHSLRSGFATEAAKAGKSERAIMRQTGHRSPSMVRRYIRDANIFSDNAADGIL